MTQGQFRAVAYLSELDQPCFEKMQGKLPLIHHQSVLIPHRSFIDHRLARRLATHDTRNRTRHRALVVTTVKRLKDHNCIVTLLHQPHTLYDACCCRSTSSDCRLLNLRARRLRNSRSINRIPSRKFKIQGHPFGPPNSISSPQVDRIYSGAQNPITTTSPNRSRP